MGAAVQNTGAILIHFQHQRGNIPVRAKTVISVNAQRNTYANPISAISGFFLFPANILIMNQFLRPSQAVFGPWIAMGLMEAGVQAFRIHHIDLLQPCRVYMQEIRNLIKMPL